MEVAQEVKVIEAQIVPAERVNWGNNAAKELMKVVKEVGLSRKFSGERPHLYAEAWQILGRFSGYHGIVEAPVEIYDEGKLTGFKAQAHVYDREGREISRATSFCMRDESNWQSKPMFQLASMAQTRALSKAYRLDLGWVAVLAGYSPTPAEEMDGIGEPKHKTLPPNKTKPAPSLEELKAKAIEAAKEFDFSKDDIEGWLEKKAGNWNQEDIDRIRDWYKSKKQQTSAS
jgi:hypothetical protein